MKTVFSISTVKMISRLPVVVFDLDGTLSNDEHRLKHAQKASNLLFNGNASDANLAESLWEAYHSLAHLDDPNEEVVDHFRETVSAGSNEVWIMTARPEQHSLKTIKWIEQHLSGFNPDRLIMRDSWDKRPGAFIKREHLLKCQPFVSSYELIVDNDFKVIEATSDLFRKTHHYTQPSHARSAAIHHIPA